MRTELKFRKIYAFGSIGEKLRNGHVIYSSYNDNCEK
jgi:hypothetical protein